MRYIAVSLLFATALALGGCVNGMPLIGPENPTFAGGELRCPNGAYGSTDSYGNRVCRAYGSNAVVGVQGRPGGGCPEGTYRTLNSSGTPVCRSHSSGQEFIDTSRGCPSGTYRWVDSSGNPACKKY